MTFLDSGNAIYDSLIQGMPNFYRNHLEEALEMVKKLSEAHSYSSFYYELMLAALHQQNTDVLTNVRRLIALKHDLNTSLIDFGVCLLEARQNEQAEKILGGAKIYLSLDKMEYIISREIRLKRPDVLHKLFVHFNDARKSSANELIGVVETAAKLYGKEGCLKGIRMRPLIQGIQLL